jgi:hypothetical protein
MGNTIECNDRSVLIKDVDDMDEDEKESYDICLPEDGHAVSQLRSSLYWFEYHKWVPRGSKFAIILDELVIRAFRGLLMCSSYRIDMNLSEVSSFGIKNKKPLERIIVPKQHTDAMILFEFCNSVEALHFYNAQ